MKAVFVTAALLFAVLPVQDMSIAQDAVGQPAFTVADIARARDIRERVRRLGDEVIGFWRTRGPDPEYGGFYGEHDAAGVPVPRADKGLYQQMRHLWAFSVWYRYREPTPEIEAICDNLYDFVITHGYDPSDNEFPYTVTYAGEPADSRRDLYTLSFAMLGLAEYARTFDKPAAAEYALECFRSVDARFQDDEYLGYDETAVSSPNQSKNTGNIMHLIESFTVLYEATGDPQVGQRLEEFVQVTIDHILQPEGYCRMTFSRDWTPTGRNSILYGHDLQTAWLLLDAAAALGRENDPAVVTAALSMGGKSAVMAFDTQRGGYFHDGTPDGTVTRRTKIWWVQCEGLLCLWRLYDLTGDSRYLDRLDATLRFIETYQRDPQTGEWFAGIEDGRVTDWTFGLEKGTLRKASYHDVRALVNLDRWIAARLGLE